MRRAPLLDAEPPAGSVQRSSAPETIEKFGSPAPLAATWIVILLALNAVWSTEFVLIGNDRAA